MRWSRRTLRTLEILEPRHMLAADQVFDFGTGPLLDEPNTVKVSTQLYDATAGYGWLDNSRLEEQSRSVFRPATSHESSAQLDDSILGLGDIPSAFRADVASGEYEVRIALGDAFRPRDSMQAYVDGDLIGEVSTSRKGVFAEFVTTALVDDGIIELAFDDAGGDPYWALASVHLTRIGDLPPVDPPTEPPTDPPTEPPHTDPGHQEPIPDFAASPTIVAVASGDWSDPTAWDMGRLPTVDDVVVIPEHLQLTITDTGAVADRIVVHGTLQFAPHVDTRLLVSTLHVEHHGSLIIGTQQSPITASAGIIVRDTPIDLSFDPKQYGTGILIEGVFQAHGQPGTDHNVLFTSENPSGTRGHLMILGAAQLDGVEIRDLGRTTLDHLSDTNLAGRYTVHIHLAGDYGYHTYVKNSFIHDTLPSVWRHGIVIHGTNGVTLSGNTIRNKAGSGIYLEDGTESRNIIENNTIEDIIAFRVAGGGLLRSDGRGMGDLGFEGAGIWMRGPDNIVRNNTVRRCQFGYHYFFMHAPAVTHTTPIREFTGNVAENCGKGLEYWWIGGYLGNQATGVSVIDIIARNCDVGVFGYNGGDIRITGMIENCRNGYDGGDYLQRRLSIVGATITGCEIGIKPSTETYESMRIENCRLDNATDVQMLSLFSSRFGANLPPRRVEVIDCDLLGDTKVQMWFTTKFGNFNVVQKDELIVRTPDETYQVYYREQRADYIMPQTVPGSQGAPEADLTNQQAWGQYGIAIAGAIAPANAIERADIFGLIMPTS